MATTSDLFAGRYQIEAHLGRGTFGTVERAFDTRLKRIVALKVPHRLLVSDEEFLEAFSQEAQTAAVLNHPSIVTIYDIGEAPDGTPYLAMQFVEGRPLREVLAQEGPPDALRGLAILDQLANALDYLQEKHLVHRDIKPANIMLDANDGVTLLDFGMARVLSGTHLSLSGVLAFTPLYASPEQILGERLTPASDRYSFAAVAYEVLSGRAPHGGYDAQLLLHAIRFEPPPRPEEINPALPPEAGDILVAALAKAPEDRPARATSITRDLRTVLEQPGRPVRTALPRAPSAPAMAPSLRELRAAAERSIVSSSPGARSGSSGPPVAPSETVVLPSQPALAESPAAASPPVVSGSVEATVVQPAPKAPQGTPPPAAPADVTAAGVEANIVQPGSIPPAAPSTAPKQPPAAGVSGWTTRTPLPSRVPNELRHYAAAGVERVLLFGRSREVCPTCAAARERSYPLDAVPALPLDGCTSAWGCHCEYVPLPDEQQTLPDRFLSRLNVGQRFQLDLLRLRFACGRGEALQIEIVAPEIDACPVCRAAAHAYDPQDVPALPISDCKRYPPCDCHYRLAPLPPGVTAVGAIRRLDAKLKEKGWPWQWGSPPKTRK